MTKKKKQNEEEAPVSEEAQAPAAEPEAQAAPEQPAPEAAKPEDEALETRLLRLQADFDNYRKRTLRERADWQRQAKEDVLVDLLSVIDHYELGLKTARSQTTEASVLNGFEMIYEQFASALKKHQVTPVEAEGQEFDHNLHEAITYVPSAEHPAGKVIAETRRGYKIGDKLLRAAQVVVSSGPADQQGAAEPAGATEEANE